MSLLSVQGLEVRLGARLVVEGVDLRLDSGELLGLIGPNGAGKSTVVKAIAQLLPHRGDVRLQGRSVRRFGARERARGMAYLSQDDQVQWPILVQDLVALGRHPHRSPWGGSDAAGDAGGAVEMAMRAADVWTLRGRRADQLSGGERARARLARVLAVNAPLILADEPVAALDPRHQLDVMELLRVHCVGGGGAIVVLHDLTMASRFCDRLLLLNQGRPVASGPVNDVLTPEQLRRVYGIEAVTGVHAGQAYIVPWAREKGRGLGGGLDANAN
ncbi:MAG: ABC transporter ATP-binding protein [Thiohalocapsa sp.]|jgi:iron complex transport system ATP-binding protein|uniref:ABC transporter ATP-binding protein n=1 Tax=Thiohalocapsa sp. TaxID=2497641 RepID=UPI0025D21FA0|nr:ABC transporter ATP-binding protein [Thiohalocapsa sp.]MCG6941238.1 ABC transporter ATP-binding protein [Thiohalocapsa sp.]